MTEPRVATDRYFSRAVVISSSVFSASIRRVVIIPEVTFDSLRVLINTSSSRILPSELKQQF